MTSTKVRPKKASASAPKKASAAAPKNASAEHPKISERRSGVAKDKSRRRSQAIFTLAFFSMIAVILLAVLASPLFNVAEVTATGHVRTDPAELIAASGVEVGSQLSDLDTDAAEAAIVNSSAWIKSAQVDRSWNGVVTVYVTERVAVLALPIQSGDEVLPETFMLVDEAGRQLEAVSQIPPGVYLAEGIHATTEPGQPAPSESLNAAAVVQGLSSLVADLTNRISIVDGLVSVVMHDESRIRFGDANLLEEKVIAVETLFARVDMRCLHEIDVRVPAAPSVTRRSKDGQVRAIVADLDQCV